MSKVNFFYANGTSYLLNNLAAGFSASVSGTVSLYLPIVGSQVLNPVTSVSKTAVYGLNGTTTQWDGGPASDPFPFMLDQNTWQSTRISYPASMVDMGPSIDYGADQTIALINALPANSPFALGGYSQGACVMSQVYKQIKDPAGSLYARRNDFIGGVMFGNPMRQVDFRGEIGGTWSGYWEDTSKTATTGGGGAFPATGKYARLTGSDATKWIEFAAPDDIFTASGSNAQGTNWTAGTDLLLTKSFIDLIGIWLTESLWQALGVAQPVLAAVQSAFGLAGLLNHFIDAATLTFDIGGAGHTTYPFLPPPSNAGVIPTTTVPVTKQVAAAATSGRAAVGVGGIRTVTGASPSYSSVTTNYLQPVGQTCYQMGLAWLESKAAAYATAPIILPSTGTSGWSTTLVPPAS